jgi:hypothetical protein
MPYGWLDDVVGQAFYAKFSAAYDKMAFVAELRLDARLLSRDLPPNPGPLMTFVCIGKPSEDQAQRNG